MTDQIIRFVNVKHGTKYTTRKQVGDTVSYDFLKQMRKRICPTLCCMTDNVACTIGSNYTIVKNKTVKPVTYTITPCNLHDSTEANDSLLLVHPAAEEAVQAGFDRGYRQGYQHGQTKARDELIANQAAQQYKAQLHFKERPAFAQAYAHIVTLHKTLKELRDLSADDGPAWLKSARWNIALRKTSNTLNQLEDVVTRSQLTANGVER